MLVDGYGEAVFAMRGVRVNVGKVTVSVILACLLVYFTPLNSALAPVPVLSSLCHANSPHLFYNLLNLFIFGNLIELKFGPRFTLFLLIASTVSCDAVFRLAYPGSIVVGISGYVYGLMASASMLTPNARALVPLGVVSVPMPVKIAVPLLGAGEFLLNFFASDNIAHISHLAGIAVGIVAGAVQRFAKGSLPEQHEEGSWERGEVDWDEWG